MGVSDLSRWRLFTEFYIQRYICTFAFLNMTFKWRLLREMYENVEHMANNRGNRNRNRKIRRLLRVNTVHK